MKTINANSLPGYVISLFCGIIFGYAMQKARIYDPSVIRNQMDFSQFVMLKVFLTAAVTSAIVFFILYNIKNTKENVISAQVNMGGIGRRGLMPVVLGGFLLGSGLYLSGTCPGMVWVELGSFVKSSIFTLLGTFVGTFIYANFTAIEKYVVNEKKPIPAMIMDVVHCSYNTCALIFITLLISIIIAVEYYFPWRSELPISFFSSYSLTSPFWPPIMTGIAVGLLQFPLLSMGKFLGTSASFMTILAQLYDKTPSLKSMKTNYWQVVLVFGIFLGSFLSYYLTYSIYGSHYLSAPSLSPLYSFIGGILLLIGAKMMRACTSGQGLSGMPLMCFPSMIATCFIFVGGITSSLLLKKYGF
ncbi:hypothetical protein WA158_004781 [Blastocystis sp. Blastoise]